MILLDTSGLLAALASDQARHRACADILRENDGPFLLSPFVLAELDYLVVKLAGVSAELEFLAEVARGTYELAPFTDDDVGLAHAVVERYRDLAIGLADASIVVLSERFSTNDVLTLDHRHFRTLCGARGRPFRIFPADR